MDRQQIIMNFSVPPRLDEIEIIAREILDTLPEEILERCEDLGLLIEEFPDETIEADMELEDPYELIALYRSGKQVAPGVERKVANDDDVLVLYRRPLLDMWCETGEDLRTLVRQVVIEELAQNFDFSEDQIEEMTAAAG